VQSLQRQDLQDFWSERYHPNDALFAIAGKFDWEHVQEKIQTLFSDWEGSATPSPEQHPQPRSSVTIEYREGKQEHLALMTPFPNYTDADYYAAMVVAEVLGGNMASRLFVEVREKRGLVYGVSAGLTASRGIGGMRIYAGTTPEQGRECLQVILDQLRVLRQDGITADELERAKIQLKSETIMRSEGSGSRMSAILRSWWYDQRFRTIQEVRDGIDSVTQEQVLQVLQRYTLVEPLTVAAIGPLSQEELVGDLLS
jgi:predicted Zn-dependent peptidase